MSHDKRTLHVFLVLSFLSLSLLVAAGPDKIPRTSGPVEASPASSATDPAVEGNPRVPAVEEMPIAVTDAQGNFYFTDLARGTHRLTLDLATLPAELRPAAEAPTVALWINPGQSLVSELVGAGVRFSAHYDAEGAAISGTVFVDENENGRQDPAEATLPGVTVIDPTVHQYFIPFNDNDLWTLFAEINDDGPIGQCLNQSPTSTNLESFISLTASSNGTVYYYDHWEDGYDPNPLSPGGTTESSAIDAGVTKTFNNIVATPVSSGTLPYPYDGRDRITIFGEPASVIRAVYPEAPGEVLAGAWEIPEVVDWGQSFMTVIGEDLDFNGPDTDDFDYVGLQIMAAQAGTEVWINGSLADTLETGATYLIDGENNGPGGGGVQSGDEITATGPIQVQMLGAACDINWSARAFTLQPVRMWDTDYWAPVPDFEEGAWCDITEYPPYPEDRDTDIYIHNPHDDPITVDFDDGSGPIIPFNVPAHETISALAILNAPPYSRDLSATIGAHLHSDADFWGVSAVDSNSGGDFSANSFSSVNDWGYSLVPVNRLSSQVVLGWSPGNSNVPPNSDPAHNNGSLAFVSTLTDTVIFVDFTQDDLPDPFDINGDGDANDFDVFGNPNFDEPLSDDGIPVSAGEVLRVADPNDNDLTGAVIYSPDLGAKLAVAWGQDPCRSTDGAPYLDLGYTVLPVPIPSLSKQSTLALDADTSSDASPGDTISYTIVLRNNGLGPLLNGVLTDTLPYTYTDYVVGSLSVTQPPALGSREFYSLTWGYTPTANGDGVDPAVRAFRLSWPRIQGRQTVTISFGVRLQDDIPSDVEEISNQALFTSSDTGTTTSQDPSDPLDPDTDVPIGQPILQIDKIDEPDPVRPGQLLTYTIVTTNTGTASAQGALVLETLPPYVTYVSDTLDLTLPSLLVEVVTTTVPYTTTFTGNYADDFDSDVAGTTVYTGSDGTLDWSGDWVENNDDGDPGAGDVQIGSAAGAELSPAGYLELSDNDGADSGLQRTLDLSEFVAPTLSFYVSGINTGAADTYSVLVNGTTELSEAYTGPYARRRVDLSAYAGDPNATLEFVGPANLEGTDFYRVDNVVVYEASPLRSETRTSVKETETLTYTTQNDINPVSYDPVARTMSVTNQVLIPVDAQVRFSFQVRVAIPLPDGMQLLNTAAITSTNVITRPYPLEDTEPTTILSGHALTLTKSAITDTVFLGQRLTYNLLWEVGGDEPAPGLVVTDTLPLPYVSFVSCAGGLGCSFIAPDTIVWELGDRLPIASGITYDSGVLTATVRAEQHPPGGTFTNTAILDDDTDVPPDQDDEPTNVVDAGFVLDKTRISTSPVGVDDPVQFLIVITNTGALTLTRLPLEDSYDTTYLSYQEATPASDDNLNDGLINWSDLTTVYGPLAPGDVAQVIVNFLAVTSTQHLTPPVTINTAVSDGAETALGPLPPVQDDADVGIESPVPDAIELLYLRVEPRDGGLLVEWATLYEIDTHGFWLYRATRPQWDQAEPLTFLPAEGWRGLGARYEYRDADLTPGSYYYWLVEVENDGQETAYGPVGALAGWSAADLPYKIYLPLLRRD